MAHRASLGEVAFQAMRFKARRALERKQARSKLMKSFQSEDKALWKEAVARSGYSQKQLALIPIPRGKTRVAPLLEDRKRAFMRHMNGIVARSFDAKRIPQAARASAASKTAADPDAEHIETCCRLCGGGCCSGGDNHAHLDEESITEFRALFPGKTPAETARAYVACLPDQAVVGSCIMHSPSGCALPRRLRSQTCNRYLCKGVRESLHKLRNDDKLRACYLVQRRLDNLTWPSNAAENKVIATHLIATGASPNTPSS